MAGLEEACGNKAQQNACHSLLDASTLRKPGRRRAYTQMRARTYVSVLVDIWPRSELDLSCERLLPTPTIRKNILRGKKRAAKLHTTSFVLQNDLHINSDLSKCSPLLAGCDLQAKIKDGRRSHYQHHYTAVNSYRDLS